MQKPITHFALDTSFIIAQNFLAGTLIKNLGEMGNKKDIKIYITDINYREVLAGFAKKLTEETGKIRSIENQIRVLKNFENIVESFSLPELRIDELIERFKADFDQWISSSKVKVLPTSNIPIGKIMDDYFACNPPFGEGKKKSEFPDAFSFYALEQFFKMGKLECYLVTNDSDFDGLSSQYILPTKNIGEKLDLINRAIEQKFGILKLINKTYMRSKGQLEKEAKTIFTGFLDQETEAKIRIFGVEIDYLESSEVADIKLEQGYNIISQNEFGALLQCTALVAYKITFILKDINDTPHLRKTDFGYIGIEYGPHKIEAMKAINFYVRVDLTDEAKKAIATLFDMDYATKIDLFDDRVYEHFYP